MKLFALCWGQTVLYTLGVIVACGLAVEICYRLFFLLAGQRASYYFWLISSYIGSPVHEGGHALMCLLFGHRIQHIRLVPTRAGGAEVSYTYNRKNPYAVFGNLWIGIGPIISGVAVILLILTLVYPESMQAYQTAVGTLLENDAPVTAFLTCIGQFLRGLVTEQTRAVWLRVIAAAVLFCLALHVRLSASDIVAMLAGVPYFLLLTALASLVAVLIGGNAPVAMVAWLQKGAWLLVSLFSLVLILALLQLALALLLRLVYLLFRLLLGKK